MTFANIITVCTNKTEHITDLTSDIPATYVPYIEIELYGIPSDWDEAKVDRVLNKLEEPVPIGIITGYLVLGQAISLNGGDIVDFCDAVSQPIENAASALTEKGGPLTGDSNLFHIMDFSISDTADSDDIKTLLTELPDIIFTHSEDVELLLEYGYTCDEIEEMLMDTNLLHEALRDVKYMLGEDVYENCCGGIW